MSIVVFDSQDGPYRLWLQQNPQGFVVNTEKRGSSRKTILHQSGCFHITRFSSGREPNPLTGQNTIKVCSSKLEELLVWCRENRPKSDGFSHRCRTCNPL